MSVALNDPVAVYTAATNTDAHLIASQLTVAGIDAVAVDDMSPGGMYSLGTLSELHRPQVFVDRSRVADAAQFLAEYETRSVSDADRYCYHCGALCDEDAAECSACNSTLDWDNTESDETEPESRKHEPADTNPMSLGRRLKKPIAFVILVPALIWIAGLAFGVVRMILSPFLD